MTSKSSLQAGSARAIPFAVPPSTAARWRCSPIGLAIALIALPASALPPSIDDDDLRGPRLTRQDTVPHELFQEERRGAPLWFTLDASIGRTPDGASGFGAMLLLGIPLDRLAQRLPGSHRIATGTPMARGKASQGLDPARSAPAPASAAPPSPERNPSPTEESAPPAASAPPAPIGQAAAAPPPSEPPVTAAAARAAVQAALQRAKLVDPDTRIDALASRARSSALLPELRVRVSRTVDEGQTLSPTEYDPARITASGGVSLWLEARATWRLDRLVFADEEVALERVRSQRAEAQAKVIERVLDRLFAWQRALAREADPSASPEEHLSATLKRIEAEVELDILTAGWFTRWRSAR